MGTIEPIKTDQDKIILSQRIEETRNSLQTDSLSMSLGEIISLYEHGELIINPSSQRLFRWSKKQQTRFLESLILGIPTPPIYIAENQDGNWELIDGVQRVSTLLSFFGLLKNDPDKNNWTMSEGELIDEFEGFNCDNLPFKLILNLKRAIWRVEIVKWNSKMDMRFELFNRLNTGGTPLTDQEIRNNIFRGISPSFSEYLAEMSSIPEFVGLIKITKSRIKQMYLDELVLRFTSLVFDWDKINEGLPNYMTKFMGEAVRDPKFDYCKFQDIFVRTVHLLSDLGKGIFLTSNGLFSTSLFEGITIGVANNIDFYEKNKYMLNDKIKEIKKDNEFNSYMGSSASSKNRVKGRIRRAIRIFEHIQ
jgi:hypothetical protein